METITVVHYIPENDEYIEEVLEYHTDELDSKREEQYWFNFLEKSSDLSSDLDKEDDGDYISSNLDKEDDGDYIPF